MQVRRESARAVEIGVALVVRVARQAGRDETRPSARPARARLPPRVVDGGGPSGRSADVRPSASADSSSASGRRAAGASGGADSTAVRAAEGRPVDVGRPRREGGAQRALQHARETRRRS